MRDNSMAGDTLVSCAVGNLVDTRSGLTQSGTVDQQKAAIGIWVEILDDPIG
jgi:hypothetical protein